MDITFEGLVAYWILCGIFFGGSFFLMNYLLKKARLKTLKWLRKKHEQKNS